MNNTLSQKKCFVLDLDGTVYLGRRSVPGTIDFIRKNKGNVDFYFLTNNTSATPARYVEKLSSHGLQMREEQFITPLASVINYVKEKKLQNLYVVATREVRTFMQKHWLGVRTDSNPETCEAVILCYDTELDYRKMTETSFCLQNPKCEFLVSHRDKVCPSDKGNLPDCGAMVALFSEATGRSPDKWFGKPDPSMLAPVLAKYAPEDIVLVGDRLYTDWQLSKNAGIDFVLVLSGETKASDLKGLSEAPPTVLEDLSQLIL
jgi:HAD superfamily hydrolase (TIGR01450 family)